jgi:nuclear pore complex protein Nup133
MQLLVSLNIEKLFYEEYLLQNADSIRVAIDFCDTSVTKNSIYILASIRDDDGGKFIIGELDCLYRTVAQAKLKSFHTLANTSLLNSAAISKSFHMHAMDNQHAFFVYNSNQIVSFTGPSLDETADSKFTTLGDRLIASNFIENDLVFFSVNHGMLKAKDTSLRLTTYEQDSLVMSMNQTSHNAEAHLSDLSNVSMQSGDETMLMFNRGNNKPSLDFTFSNLASTDQFMVNRLKESFQCYLKKEERESQAIIDELLKSMSLTSSSKKVDFLCVELSEKIIDDMPAHDPRWAELNNKKSMNTNLIISNQLKGKVRLHEYFLIFLKKFSLWDKLTCVSYNGRDIMTKLVFQEHGQKLQVALCIREQLFSLNSEFISQAIEYTTKNRQDLNSKLIYPHDVFYRRVSKVEDIFNALYTIENETIKVNSNDQAIKYLTDCTQFFVKLLKVSQLYRQDKQKLYETTNTANPPIEFVHWTFLPLKEIISAQSSILNICIKQHKLCSEFGLANCDNLETKAVILQGLFELDSLIFDEHELRLDSCGGGGHDEEDSNLKLTYDSLKTKLNQVYFKHKQAETAMKLAEKYVDFSTLVTICEQRSDTELLQTYLDKFAGSKFSEFVVKHFMEKRKLNFLLKSQFLKRDDISSHLDEYMFVSWIKDLKNEKFLQAAKTIGMLGLNENDSFMKQRTLLSMSKLSLIADGGLNEFKQELAELNRRLKYLSYIEHIAVRISKRYGFNLEEIGVSKPEKLIGLYIEDQEATEVEFKRAFELIDFLNDDETTFYSPDQVDQLRAEILVRSILSDNWEQLYDQDYPETLLNQTKFFKTIYSLKSSEL